jgi:PIN domain nuclease of toxin-antitoxin system
VILLDTHTWLWWCGEDSQLSRRAKKEIDNAARLYVCPISCLEIATAVAKRRLHFDRDVLVWLRTALARPRVELTAISLEIAVLAGEMVKTHGDPADRLIVATASVMDVPLITKDRRLRPYPGLRTIW